MPGENTPFEALWVDRPNAVEVLQQKLANKSVTEETAAGLAHLIKNGWTVIPKLISAAEADALSSEIDSVVDRAEYFISRRQREAYAHPTPAVYDDPTMRIIDYHVNSGLAQQAIFKQRVADILHAAFEDDLNAFQCLTFHYGSQQSMHQDGAYVVVSKPLQFMASWIALEDVTPGSGELTYYTGSHRLDDFLFGSGSKSWRPAEHGKEIHREFLDSLITRSEAAGFPRDTFLPRKGDALIWASDLVHGGAAITNNHTRRSLVTHYCPASVLPNFSTFTEYYHHLPISAGCGISSRHYDLRPQDKTPFVKRIFSRSRPTPRLHKPAFMGS